MYAGCNDTREIVVWKPNLDERGTCIPKLFLNPDVSRVFYNKITGHLFVAYEEKDKLDVFTILY